MGDRLVEELLGRRLLVVPEDAATGRKQASGQDRSEIYSRREPSPGRK
jgi:hypothetical protein